MISSKTRSTVWNIEQGRRPVWGQVHPPSGSVACGSRSRGSPDPEGQLGQDFLSAREARVASRRHLVCQWRKVTHLSVPGSVRSDHSAFLCRPPGTQAPRDPVARTRHHYSRPPPLPTVHPTFGMGQGPEPEVVTKSMPRSSCQVGKLPAGRELPKLSSGGKNDPQRPWAPCEPRESLLAVPLPSSWAQVVFAVINE